MTNLFKKDEIDREISEGNKPLENKQNKDKDTKIIFQMNERRLRMAKQVFELQEENKKLKIIKEIVKPENTYTMNPVEIILKIRAVLGDE